MSHSHKRKRNGEGGNLAAEEEELLPWDLPRLKRARPAKYPVHDHRTAHQQLIAFAKRRNHEEGFALAKRLFEGVGAENLRQMETQIRDFHKTHSPESDPFSSSALLEAAENGQDRIVDLLLSNGWSLDVETSRGCRALNIAAYRGHENVVSLLLQKWNVNPDCGTSHPAIVQASKNGHVGVVRRLVEAGASVFARDVAGCNALHKAIGWGQYETVAFLLENTDLLHHPTHSTNGLSYLHTAAYYSRYSVGLLRLLISHGVNLDELSATRGTALHIAHNRNADPKIIRILVSHGASIWIESEQIGGFGKIALLKEFYPSLKKAVDEGWEEFKETFHDVRVQLDSSIAEQRRVNDSLNPFLRDIILSYVFDPTTFAQVRLETPE